MQCILLMTASVDVWYEMDMSVQLCAVRKLYRCRHFEFRIEDCSMGLYFELIVEQYAGWANS